MCSTTLAAPMPGAAAVLIPCGCRRVDDCRQHRRQEGARRARARGLLLALLLSMLQRLPHATRPRRPSSDPSIEAVCIQLTGPRAAQNSAKVGFFCSGPPPAGGS